MRGKIRKFSGGFGGLHVVSAGVHPLVLKDLEWFSAHWVLAEAQPSACARYKSDLSPGVVGVAAFVGMPGALSHW